MGTSLSQHILKLICAYLAMTVLGACGASEADLARTGAKEEARLDSVRMIEALANKNPPPKLLKTRGSSVPLFAQNYDWDEQTRVNRTFVALARDERPELFTELLSQIGDERYSLTIQYGAT